MKEVTSLCDVDLKDVLGVLIDFDDTLYNYKDCHDKSLLRCYARFSEVSPVSLDDFLLLYRESQEKVKFQLGPVAASHSRVLYFHSLCETVFGKSDVQLAVSLEDLYWDFFVKEIFLYEDALSFLKKCKLNNIKVCLVTDLTASIQFRKMVAKGLDSLIDYVVTSEEVGAEKPDIRVFEACLKKLSLGKDNVVMIGDDKNKDINGARDYKIRTIWYQGGRIIEKDF